MNTSNLLNKVQNHKSSYFWWVIFLLLLGYWLRVYQLGGQSFWWDEVATFTRTDFSVGQLFENLFTIRNHMPLYFIITKAWIGVGKSEFTLRYLSLLFGVLTIALIARVGYRIGRSSTGMLAAFILALSPFSIWFSQEARMYTLLAFAILAANWFLLRILHGGDRRNWIGYTVALIIATYSHYMAVLVVVAHYVFFSFHYRYLKPLFRKWLLYAGVAGIFFGFWIVAIMATGGFTNSPIGWIKPARWFDPFLTLLSLSIGPSIDPTNIWPYLALLVYAVAIAIGYKTYFRKRNEPQENKNAWLNTLTFRLLLLWLFVPIFLVFLISIDLPIPQKRSIYMDRYLIVALPALILIGAWGLNTADKKTKFRGIMPLGASLIMIFSISTLQNYFSDPQYARGNWRAAIDQVTTGWMQDDIFLINESQPIMVSYYGNDRLKTMEIPFFILTDEHAISDEEMTEFFNAIPNERERAWIITEYPSIDPHGFPQDRNSGLNPNLTSKFVEDWLNDNCPRINQWSFPGIKLNLFDIDLCQTPSLTRQHE